MRKRSPSEWSDCRSLISTTVSFDLWRLIRMATSGLEATTSDCREAATE